MTPRLTDQAPQISVLNWVLGGSLISVPANRNKGKKLTAVSVRTMGGDKDVIKKDEKQEGNKDEMKEGEEGVMKSPDGKKTSEFAITGYPVRNGSGQLLWTVAQDALLLKLKAEGKTWKEILPKLRTSKKDAQARLKELTDGDTDPADKKDDSDDETVTGKKGNATGSGEVKRKGRLVADASWSQVDCETLEMLEQRYRDHKWLEMQAGFYNLTGRMVLADIIKKKFQTG